MKINATDVRDNFSEIINQVAYGKKEVIIMRRDQEMVKLIPWTQDEREKEEIKAQEDATLDYIQSCTEIKR